ncbi:short-subunit dehydrogenase [Pseudoduganella lurida]|uniref:Short-subunit dehydrogenase n=1 Tax=Pseudoduganella lurida TaxID=1036180 RepID=A0A562RBZ2_9BURK|nr:oxidoreductase [Pseudoduganella lurida]TWI66571.1 short-subunit dehydrogenase [Pseudoduganella lurida]
MTTWFITGVSGGLGKAIATAALARGDTVAGTVRGAAQLDAFETIAPGRALGFVLDVRDEAALHAAVASVEAQTAGIDVLVNNAGYGICGAVEETSLAEARAQFDVNVFGPLAAAQAVLPAMRRRQAGRIINISSVSGVATWAGTGIYCGSKHALEGIMQTMADEVAELGIKVISIQPGGMRTDYAGRSLLKTQRRIGDYEGAARDAERVMNGHAGHEPGDPDQVARVVLEMADHEEPPRQLLLGADALFYATQKQSQVQASMGQWLATSMSTAFRAP